ncbi:MAG: rRNA pseudouridine synthase [Candidatus Shikimatogenerans bostrichidophilus]|nr:MAG: rRNA pseudouridine synthase [Candidatus Shikimatogenerans bostrichidophilus]
MLKFNNKIRLNKYIAYTGICSRRSADKLINLGLISVNGKIINKLGYKILPNDIIKYNNKIIRLYNFKYIILNKPKNCITTIKDNYNRNTIMNYIPRIYKSKYRIYPVGRLDKNTTGVLLLTNDGQLSNNLLHPKNKIKKQYKIILKKKINLKDIIKLKNGIKLREGKIKIKDINIYKNNKNIILLSINVGWNRVLHRIFKILDNKILYLQRINFGGFKLNNYNIKKVGQYEILSKKKIFYILNKHKNEKNYYNKWPKYKFNWE